MQERIHKVVGHAEHLLDGYLGLRMTYALLAPLLTENDVSRRLGTAARREGFEAMRYTLFSVCVLDIVKLVFDDDRRTPTLRNLMGALSDPSLLAALRHRYSYNPILRRSGDERREDDLTLLDAEREAEMGSRFDKFWQDAQDEWRAFNTCLWGVGFQTMRDKHLAHLELRLVGGVYRTVDLGELGIKWSDVGDAVERLRSLVWTVNVLTRADFAMDHALAQFTESGQQFWQ